MLAYTLKASHPGTTQPCTAADPGCDARAKAEEPPVLAQECKSVCDPILVRHIRTDALTRVMEPAMYATIANEALRLAPDDDRSLAAVGARYRSTDEAARRAVAAVRKASIQLESPENGPLKAALVDIADSGHEFRCARID